MLLLSQLRFHLDQFANVAAAHRHSLGLLLKTPQFVLSLLILHCQQAFSLVD
jgi:hypothetical protein